MAYKIACADMGTKCPGSFTCESKDELIKHVELHGKSAHPEMKMTPDMMAKLDKAVKTV